MYDSAIAAPRFKSSIEATVDPEEGLYLFSENGHVCLTGQIYSDLAPLLNGEHLVEDIFERLCRHHVSTDILAALDLLKRHGFLAEETSAMPQSQQAFWELAGTSPTKASARLANTSVGVTGMGQVDVGDMRMLLERNGLCVADQGDVTIVATDGYLRPELAKWNRQAIAQQTPWILVKPGGLQSWLGPAIIPNKTACWECLAHRLRWHQRVETHIGQRAGRMGAPMVPQAGTDAASISTLAEAAAEVTRWIGAGGPSTLANRVISTDRLTMDRQDHILTRRPQCPTCGNEVKTRTSPKPALQPRPKTSGRDGGHRASRANDVLAMLDRHVSPITGLVGTVKPGIRSGPTDGAGWITPTFSADHNFSDMHDTRFFLREGLRRRSGGKGRSPEQARISAIAESLERYSGVFDGSETRQLACFDDLKESAILPNDCLGYSNWQYANRATLNRKEHKAHWVAEPFDPKARIEWTPLWSLSQQAVRYLPTSMCYFGYQGPDPIFGRADSNGCAAGATLEEAILQGLLELIERDAVAIWWYNRLIRRGIDLESFGDPYAAELAAHYRQLHRNLDVIDVTSDIGIPTFAAISGRTDKPEEDIIYGFGCHLDPHVALSRALTEVNQSLEAVPKLGGSDGEQTYLGGSDAIAWWQTVRLAEAKYLKADPQRARATANQFKNRASNDVLEDIQTCVSLLKSHGIEVLVLDQTRPDVNFSVVRVVAPGLRHFWARFGPGRLYNVPVKQGWLQDPTPEADLNPHVIQF